MVAGNNRPGGFCVKMVARHPLMKSIHISQLRADSFNVRNLVEEAVEIVEDDIHRTYSDLGELVKDLEGVREALFFKREKLGLKLRTIEDGLKLGKIDELNKEVDRIDLRPLGASRDVLEKNREISHLKRIERATKYLIEIDRGNYMVLDGLVSSDEKEDWKFLCFFLYNVMGSLESSEELLKYSKMIENKMVHVFEEGHRQGNKTMMKLAYNALVEMDRASSLVHIYIYSLDLFKEPVEMVHKEEEAIDLDFYNSDCNTFLDLIGKIRDTYDSSFNELGSIFPNPAGVYKTIHKKVYEDVLYTALREYLKDMTPCLFLLSLESCYKNIRILGSFIETMDPGFDSSSAANDLISQYVGTAVDKEKALFDEIYGILVLKAQRGSTYILLGEEVEFSTDYVLVYKQLLSVVSFALGRCSKFYSETDEDELIDFFFRKINSFVSTVSDSLQDRFEVVRTLKFIYLVTKRYFSSKFWKLEMFSRRVEKKIQEAFEDQIETCRMRVGVRIKQEYFANDEGSGEVLDIVRHEIDRALETSVRGKHFRIFVSKIFSFIYSALYSQMVQIVFDDEQCRSLTKYTTDMWEFTKALGCAEIAQTFSHLCDLAMLITVSGDDFESYYSTLIGRVSDSEVAEVIRCRKDRDVVQGKLLVAEDVNDVK